MARAVVALFALAVSALPVAACGSSSEGGAPDASSDQTVDVTFFDAGSFGVEASSGENPAMPPAPPALGAQLDRVGRPGVNLALDHVFDTTSGAGKAKDAYNADAVPPHWATYVPEIARDLAVYDALDGVCGNQLGHASGPTALASMLAADALWVDTAATTCDEYLAVERGAFGQPSSDCGGWTLTEDAMDVLYNAMAGTLGTGSPPGPVDNGVTAPTSAPLAGFPYLAAPY